MESLKKYINDKINKKEEISTDEIKKYACKEGSLLIEYFNSISGCYFNDDVIYALIDECDIDYIDNKGNSALSLYISKCEYSDYEISLNIDIVKKLCTNKVINTRRNNGDLPVEIYLSWSVDLHINHDIVKLLIDDKIIICDEILFELAGNYYYFDIDFIKLFNSDNLKIINPRGETLLHAYATSHYIDMDVLKYLLKFIDKNIVCDDGRTALDNYYCFRSELRDEIITPTAYMYSIKIINLLL